MTKIAQAGLFLFVAWQMNAQTFDTTGNGLLNGTYYFRQVAFVSSGDAVVLYNTITFSGAGSYSMAATEVDLSNSSVQSGTLSGTYAISASGLGYISNPLVSGSYIYGLVSNNIFIGSSTSNSGGLSDLFIATPVSSNSAASSAFTGSYSVGYMSLSNTGPTQVYNASFPLNPSGTSLGTVNVTAYGMGTTGPGTTTQSESGVKFAFTNGAATITFPHNASTPNLVDGQELLYISPDGNFIFGGSPAGLDMFIGVRTTSTPKFSGLYYQAGIDVDETDLNSAGSTATDGYYGSFDAIPTYGESLLGHQRILYQPGTAPIDFTYSDSSQLNSDGSYDDGLVGYHHLFGNGGAVSIGFGEGPVYGLNVAVQSPTNLSGSGMYLNPTGVQNVGSFALFTAGIAPGEYIVLNGTGFTSTAVQDPTFPTTLGGIQVLINFRPAPILYVSPTLIKVVVPWELSGSIVQIQVIQSNGNARSNAVTLFTSQTAPGVMTQCQCGLGDAAAQHLDYSLITTQSPAQVGDTIILYAVGLGLVSPLLNDGQVAGSSPTSIDEQTISVFIGGVQANILGTPVLVPGLVNLYQINVQVPSGVNSGENFVDISGPDSYTSQATIAIGSSGLAESAKAKNMTESAATPLHRPHAKGTPGPRNPNPNLHAPAFVF